MKRIGLSTIFLTLFSTLAFAQEKISCPTVKARSDLKEYAEYNLITFIADMFGETSGLEFEYKWTVSTGTIEDGQGTPVITVKSGGVQNVVATIEIKGFPQNCANKSSATAVVKKRIPIIDLECFENDLTRERVHLENLAILVLERDKNFTAHFYIHAEKKTSSKEINLRISRILNYLANKRKIAKNRLIFFIKRGEPGGTSICIYVTKGQETLCDDCQIIKGENFNLKKSTD